VSAGGFTVGETGIPASWSLVGLKCAVAGTNFDNVTPETGPTSSLFTVIAGTNFICNFEDTKTGATRTQGFWATHPQFAKACWEGTGGCGPVPDSEKDVNLWGAVNCNTTAIITATNTVGANQLMGGFWASISNVSTLKKGKTRSSIDQARMQLLQQLLAALLNKYGLGSDDGGIIETAETRFCGNSINDIKASIGALGSFNSSGDTVPTGFPAQAADPKDAKIWADIPFWDDPTH
jgi:hypothetical protein